MRRPRAVIAVALTLIAVVVGVIALAGGDSEDTTTSPASRRTTTEDATPRNAAGTLPPEFVDCMAEQGYEVDSPDEIHSAPPQALQACLASLHQ
jgi:hypothetical protein